MGQTVSTLKESQVNYGNYKAHKFECKWTIQNFMTIASKEQVGFSTQSKNLQITIENETYSYNLVLYSHGYNERVKDYLSIWLKKISTDEKLIQFTCTLLDSYNKAIKEKSIKKIMNIESHIGWATFCRRDFLLDNEHLILNDGNLNLNCTLEIFENAAIMNAELEDEDPNMKKSLSELSKGMNQLCLEGDFSDVTFKVDGSVFRAHKAILSARSAVFKTMMKSHLQVDYKTINITDISAEAVDEMLHYIYSGAVGSIDAQMAQELYYAADKYELNDLKKICFKVLVCNLDVDNAIDTLLLGENHSDNDLKYTSIKFIAKHAAEVQEKQKWMSLMKSHPELANKVFKYLSKKV